MDAGGVALSVHAAGRKGAPLVVLLHGWPEIAYSWRLQIPALAGAGFRVLAPDGRGFGASDAPKDVAAYGIDRLVGDVEALIDREGADKAIIVGHDWGGVLAWHFAMLRPERTAGVVGLCTPHLPRGPAPPVAALRARFGEDNYVVRLQDPSVERLFESSVEDFFAVIFSDPYDPTTSTGGATDFGRFIRRLSSTDRGPKAPVVPDEHRRVFVEAYRRSGFSGGLNWYRNMDANWARMDGVDHVIKAPSLMISAERDPILPPQLTRWMDQLTPDLEKHVVPGVGHWIQWEAPDAVNAHLTGWLQRRFGAR